ncbi:small secreted protein [Xylariaceae sp. FL0016]|nr:small secreted protein [Xylariaceae sp. FL0016]
MQLHSTLIAALLSTTALAAPTVKSAIAKRSQWHIQNMTHACDPTDKSCEWDFDLDTGAEAVAHCTIAVNASPVRQPDFTLEPCKQFTVSAGWSGQFGPGNGFTTVADHRAGLIIFAGYSDANRAGDGTYPDIDSEVSTI